MVLAFVSGAGGVGPAALLWDPCALWVWPVHQTPQARGHRRLRGGSSLRKGRSGLGLGRLRSLRRVSCSREARRGGRAHLCWGHSRSCKGRLAVSQSLNLPLPSGPRWLSLCGGGGWGGGVTQSMPRALQEHPRPHRRGQSRASAWSPPLSPGRGPRASCGESRGGRKSSGGRRGDSQGRGRPQGVTDTALRWRGPHGRRQQRISRRELGQTETSDYVLEDSPLLAACLNPSTKSLRAP